MLECLSLPCFLTEIGDTALFARPLFVYAQWILSAGYTPAASVLDGQAVPRMLRCHLVLLVLCTIGLLFEHLVEGVVDVPVFALSAVQLLCASGALAVLNAPTRRAASLEGRRKRLLCFFLHASNLTLIADVVFNAVCVVGGHEEDIVSLDLALKVGLFLFVTSLPFFALDRELAASASELTFVWKIWTIEAVDFCTILYGAIDYAQSEPPFDGGPPGDWPGDRWPALWDTLGGRHWSPALRVYVFAFAANAVLFGVLSSAILVRALTKDDGEPIVATRGYMFIATYVFVLDALTDLPVWLASLVTRAYVHNMYLAFNVIINLLALVRGVYICLVACLLPPGAVGNADADGRGAYGATASDGLALRGLQSADAFAGSGFAATPPPGRARSAPGLKATVTSAPV